ncbi:MAG: hypothetical protein IJL78_06965 [Lachnospiraceae bacterium]|nr:hypothetical protein [Lachnospiraceae bacterium]
MKKEYNETLHMLKFTIGLLVAALVICGAAFFLSTRETSAAVNAPVDMTVVEELMSLDDLDMPAVIAEMSSVGESRDESVRESIAESVRESRSVEESIYASSLEQESIEQSVAESRFESSVAESSSIEEQEYLDSFLVGSHLTARSVTYDCDDTDIPYLRRLFSNCVVIGNSRAKNAVDCGIMSENEVKYQSGVSVDVITPFALQVAYMYKPKTLFVMGLNDIGHYDGSNERFYQDYLSLVRQYQAINPGQVYLQEILPCPEEARPYFYRFFMIPDFNARIRQVCEETGAIYVSASDYADFKYINSEDHAHYGKEFYFLWAQTIATQMHLWEDLAGLGYEIN